MIESNEAKTGQENDVEKAPSDADTQNAAAAEGSEGLQKTIQDLKAQLKEKDAQIKEKENKYVYLYADFENFKKRAIKERSDLMKFGWESVAQDLLQTLDNLERALNHVPAGTDKNLVEGLNMVQNQFRSSLQKQGVHLIESLKKEFDPNLHEAVAQEESDLPSGTIVKEHSRGYTLHGRLLRPARVVVSGGQAHK